MRIGLPKFHKQGDFCSHCGEDYGPKDLDYAGVHRKCGRVAKPTCSEEGCINPPYDESLCKFHYDEGPSQWENLKRTFTRSDGDTYF